MSDLFTSAWLAMPEQQQFPPANGHEGAGHGGSGDYGGGDEGDGADRQDRAREATTAETGSQYGGAPEPEGRSKGAKTAAKPGVSPSLDQIAERKGQLASRMGVDEGDLQVSVDPATGELSFSAHGAAYGRSIELAAGDDPFAQAMTGLAMALAPSMTHAAGRHFGMGVDEATGRAMPDYSRSEPDTEGKQGYEGPGNIPGTPGYVPPAGPAPVTATTPTGFPAPEPYESPSAKLGPEHAMAQADAMVSEFVGRMAAGARSSARLLARI